MERYKDLEVENIFTEIRTLKYRLRTGWENGIFPKFNTEEQQTYDKMMGFIQEAEWCATILNALYNK